MNSKQKPNSRSQMPNTSSCSKKENSKNTTASPASIKRAIFTRSYLSSAAIQRVSKKTCIDAIVPHRAGCPITPSSQKLTSAEVAIWNTVYGYSSHNKDVRHPSSLTIICNDFHPPGIRVATVGDCSAYVLAKSYDIFIPTCHCSYNRTQRIISIQAASHVNVGCPNRHYADSVVPTGPCWCRMRLWSSGESAANQRGRQKRDKERYPPPRGPVQREKLFHGKILFLYRIK